MKTPRQIAGAIVAGRDRPSWGAPCDPAQLLVAIAAAIQAEREDGCRRVNDAIGDRDPIIDNLRARIAELEKGLEPFVEYMNSLTHPQDDCPIYDDFRHAEELLKTKGEK